MLAPGKSCSVSVVFQPQQGQAGPAAATLSINDNALDSPQTVALSGSVDDFSLTASTSGSLSAAVTAGATATYSLQVNSLNGFSGSVAITCAGAPAEATCSASPSPLSVAATGATPFSVSVPTQASVSGAMWRRPGPAPANRFSWPPDSSLARTLGLAIVVFTMAALCAAGFARRRIWRRMAVASVFIFVLLAAVALTSCGAGGAGAQATPQAGTPTGTYSLTVTAAFTPAGATTPVKRPLTLTLAVQ